MSLIQTNNVALLSLINSAVDFGFQFPEFKPTPEFQFEIYQKTSDAIGEWQAFITLLPGTEDSRAAPRHVSPQRLKLVKADIKFLSDIIKQLVELLEEEESDEFGALRANKFACDIACGLVADAAIVSAPQNREIPYGHASTDSKGGIRIEWPTPAVTVRLIVPANPEQKAYIYHQTKQGYATELATAESLSYWLGKIEK